MVRTVSGKGKHSEIFQGLQRVTNRRSGCEGRVEVLPSLLDLDGVKVTLMLERVKQVEDGRDARKGCVQTAHVIYPGLRKPQPKHEG
jgi:hypothetical protein